MLKTEKPIEQGTPKELYAQRENSGTGEWMYYDDIEFVDDGEFLVYKFERKAKKTTTTRVRIR